jgi:hypothetical protein
MVGWLILLGLLVGGAVLLSGGGDAAAAALSHVIGPRGWVEAEPRKLASLAGVSDSTYALASAMVSEAGEDARAQTAVGWALRNHADERGESVFRVLTRAGRNNKDTRVFEAHDSNGYFGPQNVGPRWASTRKAPTPMALDLASAILTDAVDDPTGGATQFDAPSAQDSLLGTVEGYVKTAQQIAEERSSGKEMVMLPGVPNIRFWVPRG